MSVVPRPLIKDICCERSCLVILFTKNPKKSAPIKKRHASRLFLALVEFSSFGFILSFQSICIIHLNVWSAHACSSLFIMLFFGLFLLLCGTAHARKILQHQPLLLTPHPKYFFPLTNQTFNATLAPSSMLSTLISPASAELSLSIQPSSEDLWTSDTIFGSVITCSRSQQTHLSLPEEISYGKKGPFALSLWVKPSLSHGDSLEYLYSHSTALEQDSVQLYFPQVDHPNYGVIRAIVRDSSDPPANSSLGVTYIDSNGCVTDVSCNTGSSTLRNDPSLVDGRWHHITLSTHAPTINIRAAPALQKGIDLYVDGMKVNSLESGVEYSNSSGSVHVATGGYPIRLSGIAQLCSRADGDSDRFFGGSLAYLRIYDRALGEEEVQNVYKADVVSLSMDSPGSTVVPASYNRSRSTPDEVSSPTEQQVATPETADTANGTITSDTAKITEESAAASGSPDDDYSYQVQESNPGSGTSNTAQGNPTFDDAPNTDTSAGGMSGGLIAGIVVASVGGTVAATASAVMGISVVRRRRAATMFHKFDDSAMLFTGPGSASLSGSNGFGQATTTTVGESPLERAYPVSPATGSHVGAPFPGGSGPSSPPSPHQQGEIGALYGTGAPGVQMSSQIRKP